MLVSEIFDLLQKKYGAVETTVIGSSVVYRMDLMLNFHIDFSFKWSTCTIELFSTNSKYGSHTTYFSSQYWINEEGFDMKVDIGFTKKECEALENLIAGYKQLEEENKELTWIEIYDEILSWKLRQDSICF